MVASFFKVNMNGAKSMLQYLEGTHATPKLGVDKEAVNKVARIPERV